MNDETYGLQSSDLAKSYYKKACKTMAWNMWGKQSHRPQSNDSKLKQMLNLTMSPDYNNKKAGWGS